MKKVFLTIGIIGLLICTSCKKEKDCVCTTTTMGVEAETKMTIEDGDCSDMDTETTMSGITTKTECVEE